MGWAWMRLQFGEGLTDQCRSPCADMRWIKWKREGCVWAVVLLKLSPVCHVSVMMACSVTHQWWGSHMQPSCHTQDRSRWVSSHSSAGRGQHQNTANGSTSQPCMALSVASYPAAGQNKADVRLMNKHSGSALGSYMKHRKYECV